MLQEFFGGGYRIGSSIRLPSVSELSSPSQEKLRQHDLAELHRSSDDPFAFGYVTRLAMIARLVDQYTSLRNARILDAACAQGNVALILAAKGYVSTGIDLRTEFVEYARLKDTENRVDWVVGSVMKLPLRTECIDVVILGEIMEHVAYPENLFGEAARVLVPNGTLVATTPNGDFVRSGLRTLADVADRQRIAQLEFKPDADGHLYLPTREEVILLGTGAGLVFREHHYYQTTPVTGWPKMQRLVRRLGVGCRLSLESIISSMRVARYLAMGQVAIFTKR